MEAKLKVFLSSAQFNDEFLVEREGLPEIFNKQPLSSTFCLWRIEDDASPDDSETQYTVHVKDSNLLILLLGNTIRPAVKNEYNIALKKGINIFAFNKIKGTKEKEMVDFIKEIQPKVTYTEYNNFSELVKKLENSIQNYYFRTARLKEVDEWKKQHVKKKETPNERSLRLLVGFLSSENADISKYHVIKSLLLETLLSSEKSLHKDNLVINSINIAHLNYEKFKIEFHNILELMLNSGELICDDENYIKLDQSKHIAYVNSKKEQEKNDIKLLSNLYQVNNEVLANISFNKFRNITTNVISQIIYDTAINMAEQEFGISSNPFSYNSDEINRIVYDSLLNILEKPEEEISNWQPVIVAILTSSDKSIICWINRLRKAYWSLAVLGLDPSHNEHYTEHLKNYCIYLDSHMVIRALVEAGSDSTMCRKIIHFSKNIGVEMRLSQSLFTEIEQAFYSANKAYLASDMNIIRAIEFFEKINRKSDIFDGYLTEKSKIPDLSWDNYLNRFYSISNPDKLEKYLNNELGIKVQPERTFTQEQLGRIEDIVQRLLYVRRQSIHPPDHLDNGKRLQWERQYILRTNEARQMAIIYELRNSEEKSKKQFWFITYDQFVYEVNSALVNAEEEELYRYPCFMKPATWLEIIVNASPSAFSINTFREVLLSRDIQQIADQIETEVITQMLKSRVDQGISSVDTLQLMFDDLVNRPAVQQAYKDILSSSGTHQISAREKFKDSIIKEMKEELSVMKEKVREYSSNLENQQSKLEKVEGRAKYLKKQVGRLMSKKKKKRK